MPSPRPFTLGDSMALVAATAVGLALDRWREAPLILDHTPGIGTVSVGASHWLHVLGQGRPSCFAVALSLVLIALRWRRPRPPASRVLRQPGAIACLATAGTIVASLSITLLGEAITREANGLNFSTTIFSNGWYWAGAVANIPMGVAGAWAALALGGRWSPERSWIDHSGRALGVYWLAVYLLGFFWGLIDLWLPYR